MSVMKRWNGNSWEIVGQPVTGHTLNDLQYNALTSGGYADVYHTHNITGNSVTGHTLSDTQYNDLTSGGPANSYHTHNTLASPATLSNPTITDYVETVYTSTIPSTATINLTNGTIQNVSITANTQINLPSPLIGKSYTVIVNYTGAFSVTFVPANGKTLKWSNNTAPTATSTNAKTDIYTFISTDINNTYGFDGGRNF